MTRGLRRGHDMRPVFFAEATSNAGGTPAALRLKKATMTPDEN